LTFGKVGAEVDVPDNEGETALHRAACACHDSNDDRALFLRCVELLVAAGADSCHRSKAGLLPSDLTQHFDVHNAISSWASHPGIIKLSCIKNWQPNLVDITDISRCAAPQLSASLHPAPIVEFPHASDWPGWKGHWSQPLVGCIDCNGLGAPSCVVQAVRKYISVLPSDGTSHYDELLMSNNALEDDTVQGIAVCLSCLEDIRLLDVSWNPDLSNRGAAILLQSLHASSHMSLRVLNMRGVSLRDHMECLNEKVDGVDAAAATVPDCLGRLNELIDLDVSCNPLLSTQGLAALLMSLHPSSQSSLRYLSISCGPGSSSNLQPLLAALGRLPSLQRFMLCDSPNISPDDIISILNSLPAALRSIEFQNVPVNDVVCDAICCTLTSLTSLVIPSNPSLCNIPPSIANLKKLSYIDVSGCGSLLSLPDEIADIPAMAASSSVIKANGCNRLYYPSASVAKQGREAIFAFMSAAREAKPLTCVKVAFLGSERSGMSKHPVSSQDPIPNILVQAKRRSSM